MEIEGQYITLYVRLMNEGVDVVRPTQAERLADGTFRLFPTPDYDPEDETWEFPPASIVAAEVQQWSSGEILVAIQPELGAIDIVELGEAVSKFDRDRRAEFLLHLANELTIAARNTYGPTCDEVENPRDLRQYNEVLHRVLANLRDVVLGSDEELWALAIIADAGRQLSPVLTACRRAVELTSRSQ